MPCLLVWGLIGLWVDCLKLGKKIKIKIIRNGMSLCSWNLRWITCRWLIIWRRLDSKRRGLIRLSWTKRPIMTEKTKKSLCTALNRLLLINFIRLLLLDGESQPHLSDHQWTTVSYNKDNANKKVKTKQNPKDINQFNWPNRANQVNKKA